MKVLILADIPGWIVDRIVDRMIQGIDFDFTKRHYACISTDEFINLANTHDLVHYNNWDIQYHVNRLSEISTPILMSIRSHRFPPYVKEVAKRVHVHVINPDLQHEFPGSHYIPDGIFDQFKPVHPFVVGFAGRADDYKGFPLIAQACQELGITFKPATSVPPDQMFDYYQSIDLLVSASVAEGFCAPVVECLAMNKPVITTDVGIARHLNVHKIERSVEGIKRGIERFYTSPQVLPKFSWQTVCQQFKDLYMRLTK